MVMVGRLRLHNFEIDVRGDKMEIDAAILTPHSVILVDFKGTNGRIEVYGTKWIPEGRAEFTTPLFKLRHHAKTLKGLLTDKYPNDRDMRGLYVDAVVVLSGRDPILVDYDGKDEGDVCTLAAAPTFLMNAGRVRDGMSTNIAGYHGKVRKLIQGTARPRDAKQQFGNWVVTERLTQTDVYTDYRAENAFAKKAGGTALLRVFQADPYIDAAAQKKQRDRIANAYIALTQMPPHPGIVGARDFFATDGEDRYVLVMEDPRGRTLGLQLRKPSEVLTLEQKFRIAGDILNALAHAHAHQVIHRNLTPGTVLLAPNGEARLTGFDYARTASERSATFGEEIVKLVDEHYAAPELTLDSANATGASDIFSAGAVLYELFTGERPFSGQTEILDKSAVFAAKPSKLATDLPKGFDDWLQRLCAFNADDRPSAEEARRLMEDLLRATAPVPAKPAKKREETISQPALDFKNLPKDFEFSGKLRVEERLGEPGAFGVVYRMYDSLADMNRAVKLIISDRQSLIERLKIEYQTLLRLQDHPHERVVRVIEAQANQGKMPPHIVFEYVEGMDVGEMYSSNALTPKEVWEMGTQVAEGLVHLHKHGIYHCDIKPRNLLWTEKGVKIIDFNVAVRANEATGGGGGTKRYIPPDFDFGVEATAQELADRDTYALVLTMYEGMTGQYPWEKASSPPAGRKPRDPRELSGSEELSAEVAEVLVKGLSPQRKDRFQSAEELLAVLKATHHIRQIKEAPPENTQDQLRALLQNKPIPPNTNPIVAALQTLYSQAQRTNAGTRGLDRIAQMTYVGTALDSELSQAVLNGEFSLVIITGNAGDGKTAWLQVLESKAMDLGCNVEMLPSGNGTRFEFDKLTYLTNYDGSQDEKDRENETVLREFFEPYKGDAAASWPKKETRLIAINEGRLVDFLEANAASFPELRKIVLRGLETGAPENRVAVVNLNLRSVVAEGKEDKSLFEAFLREMTKETLWSPCAACDLKEKCYVYHNVRTIQDKTSGGHVVERLRTLYTLTHLRARLHITLRDLRSALAFTLVGTRDCGQIHELYREGKRTEILNGFYFNSWMGGEAGSKDRLLSLLAEIDVGKGTDPRLDRQLSFTSPEEDGEYLQFDGRDRYDQSILKALYDDLPLDYSGRPSPERLRAHQRYVAIARRRAYFERKDDAWQRLISYRSWQLMIDLVRGKTPPEAIIMKLLHAINRAEGLQDPERLGGDMALQVREVDRGTIRSYRLFPKSRFSLSIRDDAKRARFVEHEPNSLVLAYEADGEAHAELELSLDMLEMLVSLERGYLPSPAEIQGHYLSLEVFKNILGAAPYQEVLLTRTGQDLYRITRESDGRLVMAQAEEGAN
jgi:serine/threonine protein kinase